MREGDACTKFFHQRAKGQNRNMIAYLKNEAGALLWKHTEKESILHPHFVGLFGKGHEM